MNGRRTRNSALFGISNSNSGDSCEGAEFTKPSDGEMVMFPVVNRAQLGRSQGQGIAQPQPRIIFEPSAAVV
jgi:hypothetical protein